MTYEFDRYLRFDELTGWLHQLAADHPELVTVESLGRSHEGRDLWLATVTDTSTGPHHEKPGHWVDANIHSVELTAGVAATYLLHHLVSGFQAGEPTVVRALQTRTFYVVPRVNPDGVEAALSDRPRYLRSSMRPWPWRDGHRWPGLHPEDIDGDGRILSMRVPDPNGAWTPHPDEPRVMIPVPLDGTAGDVPRYRMFSEGTIVDHDGFTVPLPRSPEGLDMNRNYPAGWGSKVRGSGDHPLSEPEIDALVRAITARPNVCGFNAFHTMGGVLLRPSSTRPDADLPPFDLWAWKQLGDRGTELTGYPVHSVYEDFTWDRSDLMSGASDDWAYEHRGIFGWTTEFWDAIHRATGERASTDIWFVGPTVEQELAVVRWADEHAPASAYVPWHPFEHPQLGPVELGGGDDLHLWVNPPSHLLRDEVAPHAAFAVVQALAAPHVDVVQLTAEPLGHGHWRVRAGIANTGWLPTNVTAHGLREQLVLPLVAEVSGVSPVGGPARQQLGQLAGRSTFRLKGGAPNDGTPDRTLATWVVAGSAGDEVTVTVTHPRAGTARARTPLPPPPSV